MSTEGKKWQKLGMDVGHVLYSIQAPQIPREVGTGTALGRATLVELVGDTVTVVVCSVLRIRGPPFH